MAESTIFLADDHPILLKGLEVFLTEKKHRVIGTANNGQTAYNQIITHKPEIAILDIRMPYLSGLEIARKCFRNKIKTKIILITLYKDETLYLEAKKLNVYGYLLKEFALEEIEACLDKVTKGERYFSEEISTVSKKQDTALTDLTLTERKVLSLIAKNKTSKQIAEMLFVSLKTIEKHRANIRSKLNLEPKTHALLIWVKENHGLFI